MRQLLTLIFACVLACGFAQNSEKQNAMFTIRGNIGINRPVSSQMFRTAFSGIYEANLSANLRLFGNFYFGAGYQSTYFQNTKIFKQQLFPQTSLPYNTNLIGNAGFFKLGYDRFFEDRKRGYMSYSLNGGLMYLHYSNVNADTSVANRPYVVTYFAAPYIQPEVSVNFIVEKMLSFSIMMSYTTLFYHFDPKAPRFAQFGEILGPTSNRYVMSYMNIAIGFNILIGK